MRTEGKLIAKKIEGSFKISEMSANIYSDSYDVLVPMKCDVTVVVADQEFRFKKMKVKVEVPKRSLLDRLLRRSSLPTIITFSDEKENIVLVTELAKS